LRAKGVDALQGHLERARGRRIRVLMENADGGRSADFTPVKLAARPQMSTHAGALIDAVVSGDDGASLLAEAAR
jgi:threonylcarbamoyladenosine tRNA methylthiotransferase MtaB